MELDIQMFATPYVDFKDAPNTTTPLSSTNLNKIQTDARTEIGVLSTLTTDDDTDLVSAINEVDAHTDTNTNNIASINTLLSSLMEWKLVGSVTGGSSTVTLPETFNELLISIRIGDNQSVGVNIVVPYSLLTTTAQGFNGGYWQSNAISAYTRALVTTTTVQLFTGVLNGSVVTNTSTMRVYYR